MKERFLALCERLVVRDSLALYKHMVSCYTPNEYHNLDHIKFCLERLDQYTSGQSVKTVKFDLIEYSLWLHDINTSLYRTTKKAVIHLMLDDYKERVAGLIMATDHKSIQLEYDRQLICDIDLSILGASPEVYDEYERQVRAEYIRYPDEIYFPARVNILKGLIKPGGSVFHLDYFKHRDPYVKENFKRHYLRFGSVV